MILKGSQRGGAKQLAIHLLNESDNDHIEVHAIDGFVANDVEGALREIYAISRAARCKQFMFSLSLSPPKGEIVTRLDYENAVEQAAERLGLAGQPRVILFHEKAGRRHCHAIFSRIDLHRMKAINLPYFKDRLNELAHELFLTHNWEVPAGFENREHSNPLNYSLTSHHEAKKAKRDPSAVKAILLECWQACDNRKSFEAALEEKGFCLCRGDRRGFVVLDLDGNPYSLSRWLEEKPKTLRSILGDPEHLPMVDEVESRLGHALNSVSDDARSEIDAHHAAKLSKLTLEKHRLIRRQRCERHDLRTTQNTRRRKQALERQQSLRTGLSGLWERVTGARDKQLEAFRREVEAERVHDNLEKLKLSSQHLAESSRLQTLIDTLNVRRESELQTCHAGLTLDILPSHDETVQKRRLGNYVRRNPEHVLSLLTDKESTFTRRGIAKALHSHIDDPQAYQNALARILSSKELVRLSPDSAKDNDNTRYSTRSMIALENALMESAMKMAMRGGFGVASKVVKTVLNRQDQELRAKVGITLSAEQRDAVQSVTGDEQLACVIGVAGAGKSTMLATAKESWEQAGFRVLGAALAGKAAKGLEQASGIPSKTLASYELSWRNGLHTLQKGDVLIIDEAGMIGSKQMARFVAEAKDKGAKLVLIGDAEQLQPINAGAPFRAISEAMSVASLSTVHRQEQQWQQQASKDFADGRTHEALKAYDDHGSIQMLDTAPEAEHALV